jgi:hypothetical protein
MYAELEFMQKRGQSVLELPTGQGLVLKSKSGNPHVY